MATAVRKAVAGWKYGDRRPFERHFFAYPLLRLGTCREADLRARHRTEIIWIDETGLSADCRAALKYTSSLRPALGTLER